MSAGGLPPNRLETELRRLLDTRHPAVPADLARRAAARGRSVILHRRVLRYALCAVLLAAAATAAVLLA